MRILALLTLALLAAPAAAVDVSGVWALNIVDRDGTHTQGYCTLTQEGLQLTGTCGLGRTDGLPLAGDIHDRELAWQVEGGPSFKATLDERGTFMRGAFSLVSDGIFTGMKTN